MTNGKRKFGDDARNWNDDKDVTHSNRKSSITRKNNNTDKVHNPRIFSDGVDANRSNDDNDNGNANGGKFKSTVSLFVHSWRIWVVGIILVAAVVLPFTWVKLIQPAIDRSRIDSDPKIQESKAAIIPYDHVWKKTILSKNTVDGANVNESQIVIKQESSEAGATSCFVFHAEGKDSSKHEIKVTGAFGDSKTRDFFNAQQYVLEKGMKSGKIKVEVCMLLTNDEYSALATEALGEIDYNNQKNTWSGLMALLRVDSENLKTGDARVGAVMNVVNSIPNVDGKVNISKESIKNGSFLQWARIMTNDNSVEKIPALWIDDKNYSNNEKYKITNPDWLMDIIMNLS